MSNDPIRRIDELQRELDELRAHLASAIAADPGARHDELSHHPSPDTTVSLDTSETGSRRQLLRLAAGAVAGGTAALVATTGRVAAADGDPIEIGTTTLQGDTGRTTTVVRYANPQPPQAPTIIVGELAPANAFLVRDDQGGLLTAPNTSAYPAAVAGYGYTVLPNGVYGFAGTNGGHGVVGYGASGGIGVLARGGRANLRLHTDGAAAPSRSDAHQAGEMIADSAGRLWYCTVSGTPGTWIELSSPSGPGAFVAIDPVRVYDSRQPAYPNSGLLAPNGQRTISVADGRDASGTVTTPDAVPPGASAIAFNVTVTGTTGPNFVSVVPGDATGYTTSSINWSAADQSVANGSIVRIDGSRQVKVFGGDQSGSAHVIIDVGGYFT